MKGFYIIRIISIAYILANYLFFEICSFSPKSTASKQMASRIFVLPTDRIQYTKKFQLKYSQKLQDATMSSNISGKPRVLVIDAISENAVQPLQKIGCQIDFRYDLPPSELRMLLSEGLYNVIIVRSYPIDQETIKFARNLFIIGRAGVGVDKIDISSACEHGILVINSPNGNSVAVAEHTFALMLALARRLLEANLSISQGKWEKNSMVGTQLKGKTLGILGFGSIGKQVTAYAKAFGMTVLTTSQSFDNTGSQFNTERMNKILAQGATPVSFEEVLRSSDFLTLHLPLTDQTRNIIGKEQLAKMKSSSFLINVARGGIVNEQDLLEAIQTKRIGGAGIDVFEKESSPTDDTVQRLSRHPKVICTPHIGASTPDASFDVLNKLCVELAFILKGERPVNLITTSGVDNEQLISIVRSKMLKSISV